MQTLPNCDCCGKFHRPTGRGCSGGIRIIGIGYDYDIVNRCAKCTKKHGPYVSRRAKASTNWINN